MTSDWTPERREQQREVALKLVEEGRFGGRGRGQGRPRKRRASEIVAEQVANEGQAIFDSLIEIVRDGKEGNRISAAKTLLDTEEKERIAQIEEEIHLEEMRGHDLAELIYNQLMELTNEGIIELPFIEGELIEITKGETDRVGEESETPYREE